MSGRALPPSSWALAAPVRRALRLDAELACISRRRELAALDESRRGLERSGDHTGDVSSGFIDIGGGSGAGAGLLGDSPGNVCTKSSAMSASHICGEAEAMAMVPALVEAK